MFLIVAKKGFVDGGHMILGIKGCHTNFTSKGGGGNSICPITVAHTLRVCVCVCVWGGGGGGGGERESRRLAT